LVATLPFVVFWSMRLGKRFGPMGLAASAAAMGVLLLLMVGLGVTLSRAGVILGGLCLVGGLAMVLRTKVYAGRTVLAAGMLAGVIAGVVLIGLFARGPLAERFQARFVDEGRVVTAPTIIKTAETFSPVGAGFGAFVPAYQMFEPTDQLAAA